VDSFAKERAMMKINSLTRTAAVALTTLSLSSCSNMDETQQRMVSGGAIGVAVGAVGTVVTGGCVACGMAIGGAVGTATGYVVEKFDSTTKSNSGPQQSSGYGNNNNNVPQGYPQGGYGSQ
jgi:osmotically inducible lipoprotein OsmB